MPGVSLKGLVKRYGAAVAVDGIDLHIGDGELVVLLGPSGCGKTTTLRCIAGLEEITGGEIRIGDQLVSGRGGSVPAEKRAIGMVFQSYAIWPHMTVAQNVAFGLDVKRLPAAESRARVQAALDMVGLAGFAGRGASQLSGGQQQRVALARAIVLEPAILLFDEPLSNLDARLRERMRFELRELQQRLGTTAVYVTHDQQEAMALADRIVLMNGGRIEQIGTPEDIYDRPVSRFAAEFVGLTNALPGTVTDTGAATRVRLAGGQEIVSARGGMAAGDEVDLIVRPERIRLSAEPLAGPNMFEAVLTDQVFLGSLAEYALRLGETELRAQASPPWRHETGAPVWIELPPEHVTLLPRAAA